MSRDEDSSTGFTVAQRRGRAAGLVSDVFDGVGRSPYLEQIRAQLMVEALDRTSGVQTQAAELLGMTFRSFRYYAKKAGLKGGDGE